MHDCIVEIRIEFLPDCFDGLYSCTFQCSHQLLIDLLHSLDERIFLLFLLDGSKPPLETVNNRKYLIYDIFRSNLVHLGLLLIRALAKVIKLCHLTSEPVCKLLYLLVLFVLFILLAKELLAGLLAAVSGIFLILFCPGFIPAGNFFDAFFLSFCRIRLLSLPAVFPGLAVCLLLRFLYGFLYHLFLAFLLLTIQGLFHLSYSFL